VWCSAPGGSAVCLRKALGIPDKWIDNHDVTEPIDQNWDLDDTFETVDAHGNPLFDADVYRWPSAACGLR
jgi:hypothetical protein